MNVVYPPVPADEERTYGTASYGLTLEQLKYTCLEKATVVGVNYEANTIDIELDSDSTAFAGVKYLCHTDIDYYSYLTNGLDIPSDPTEVFSHTAHCFMYRSVTNTVTALVVRLPAELGGSVSCAAAIPYRSDVDPCKGETFWAYYLIYAHLYVRTGVFETKVIVYDRFRNKFADIVNNAGNGLVAFPCDYSELSSWLAAIGTDKISEAAGTSSVFNLVQYGQPENTDAVSESWWETTLNDSDSTVTSECTEADGTPTPCDHNGIYRTDTTIAWSERSRTPARSGSYYDVALGYNVSYDTYGSYHERYDNTTIRHQWINIYGITSTYEFTVDETHTWDIVMGVCPSSPVLDYNQVNYSFLGVEVASLRTKQTRSRSYVVDGDYTTDFLFTPYLGTKRITDTTDAALTYESNLISHNFTYTNIVDVYWQYELPVPDKYYSLEDQTTFYELTSGFKGAITTDGDAGTLFLAYAVVFLYFPIWSQRVYRVSNYSGTVSLEVTKDFYVNFVLYDAMGYTDDPAADLPALISTGPGELTSLMQDLLETRFEGDDGTIGSSYFDAPEIWVAKFDNRIRAF
ncbi:MAG TPA: hypothetical protein DCZ63_15665 [Geobacter sp.]|nr:hypothetical protein [Geobacter sp.]